MKTNLLQKLMAGALMATVVAAPAYACGGKHGEPSEGNRAERREHRQDRMAKRLGLSEDQQAQLKQIREAKREQFKANRETLKANREAMKAVVDAKDFDEAAARKIAQEHAQLKADMMVQGAKTRHQMRQVLTEEQQQKWDDMKVAMHAKHSKHWKH